MPALVNSSVGSLPGTSGDEGTIVCPLLWKNSRNLVRKSLLVMGLLLIGCAIRGKGGGKRGAMLNKWLRRRHRSEEHTSELQSLMRISYAVFCLKKKKTK